MKAKESKKVAEVIAFVRSQTGIDLVIDEYFDEIKRSKGKTWFSVEIEYRITPENKVFVALERISGCGPVKSVSQNGLSRIAIYI